MRAERRCFSEMVEHCKEEHPHEACGLLAGKDKLITKVYTMTNTSGNPETCYFMDPQEQLQVFKEIRNSGLEILGIYHSHGASSAYPSPRDVEMAFYPEAIYVIVSLTDPQKPEVGSFRIVEGEIEKEELIQKTEDRTQTTDYRLQTKRGR